MNNIYRCTLTTCPYNCEPCELTEDELNKTLGKSTPCPIGEDDYFQPIDIDNEFFCLIVGSRSFIDYDKLKKSLDKLLIGKINKNIIIVSGGAKGADALAERYAKEKGYQLYVFPAEWEKGKFAGYERNEKMHKYISTKKDKGCVAFWDGKSKGTEHSFYLAKKYNNSLRVITFKN